MFPWVTFQLLSFPPFLCTDICFIISFGQLNGCVCVCVCIFVTPFLIWWYISFQLFCSDFDMPSYACFLCTIFFFLIFFSPGFHWMGSLYCCFGNHAFCYHFSFSFSDSLKLIFMLYNYQFLFMELDINILKWNNYLKTLLPPLVSPSSLHHHYCCNSIVLILVTNQLI